MAIGISGCSHTPGDAAYRAGHPDIAAEMYKAVADGGDGTAALKLGLMMTTPDDLVVPIQWGTASDWFFRACDLGEIVGCHNAGVASEYGQEGAQKNLEKALAYYRKAAERGYVYSQYNLASMYSNNYVIPEDPQEGYKWMLLAQYAAKKYPRDIKCQFILRDPPGHKSRLEKRLSLEQIKEATENAALWRPKKKQK